MTNDYLMRSLMFVPAHNEKLMDSALRRDADVLLLDIEVNLIISNNLGTLWFHVGLTDIFRIISGWNVIVFTEIIIGALIKVDNGVIF